MPHDPAMASRCLSKSPFNVHVSQPCSKTGSSEYQCLRSTRLVNSFPSCVATVHQCMMCAVVKTSSKHSKAVTYSNAVDIWDSCYQTKESQTDETRWSRRSVLIEKWRSWFHIRATGCTKPFTSWCLFTIGLIPSINIMLSRRKLTLFL